MLALSPVTNALTDWVWGHVMSRVDTHLATRPLVQTGEFELISSSGGGERGELDGTVTFDQPFSSTPKVVAALSVIDVGTDSNTRLRVEVTDAFPEGFTYRFYTWSSTRVHVAKATWVAIAQTASGLKAP